MIKMHDDFQKVESILATYIRIKHIDLNIYLHLKNISSMNNSWCNCKQSHQTAKHVLMMNSDDFQSIDDSDLSKHMIY